MKTLFLVLCSFCFFSGGAQSLKKYPIGKSGCSIYNYCLTKFTVDYSEDSSSVYTGECELSGITYGVICVKLLHEVKDLGDAEALLVTYLSHLKTSFNIIKSAGLGYGHYVTGREEDTRGVIDYWTDNAGDQWKIKAYTDGKFIGFMYAYSKEPLPEGKVNVFLDGFRLP